MIDLIGGLLGKIALLYFLRTYYDVMMVMGGMVLAITLTWKSKQKSTSWKFNPKQVFDMTILGIALYLIVVGTVLVLANHVFD